MMDVNWWLWLWNQLWPNLLADVLFSTIVSGVLFLIARWVITRRRKQLFAFFGVDFEKPVVRIYVSRLDVAPDGSIGVDGRLGKGFSGEALMKREYEGALAICALFREKLLDVLPRFLQDVVGRLQYLSDVETSIDVSPSRHEPSLLDGPHLPGVVVLGSDVYNHVVREVYDCENVTFVRFVGEMSGKTFNASIVSMEEPTFAIQVAGDYQPIRARERAGREIGTVQRITVNGRRLLMCAGISSSSTSGAARYVAENWMALHRRFGARDFYVVLGFPDQEPDKDSVNAMELEARERQ